jgi:hypothetical protein
MQISVKKRNYTHFYPKEHYTTLQGAEQRDFQCLKFSFLMCYFADSSSPNDHLSTLKGALRILFSLTKYQTLGF